MNKNTCFGMFVTGIWFVLLGCCCAAGAASTQASQPAAQRVALVEKDGFVVSQLNNGLTVVVQEDHSTELVSLNFFVRTGSIYERPGGAGLSHLLEHLVMGGTTSRHTEQQAQEIRQKLGNNSNAYTSKSLACYWITTTSLHARQAFSLLTEFLTDASITQTEYQREFGVVQRELEQYANNPMRQLRYLTFECLYQGHPAAYPVIGYQPIVKSITAQQVRQFYQQMYRPDNMVVVVAGHVKTSEVLDWVAEDFSSVTRRPISQPVIPPLALQASPRKMTKHMATPSALVSLAWPTVSISHRDLYGLDVLAYLLSQGESSLLIKDLVLDKKLAYGVSCSSLTPGWGKGFFQIVFRCRQENIEPIVQRINQHIKNLARVEVDSTQLQRVKRQKTADYVFSKQDVHSRAQQLGWDFMTTNDAQFSDHYVQNIQKVTPKQIVQVVGEYLVDSRLCRVEILPQVGPTDSAPVATQADRPTDGPTRHVLPNGLKVLIWPRDNSPIVAIDLYFLGGLISDGPQQPGLSDVMAQMLLRGTSSRTAEQIAQFFDSRGARIAAGAGRNTFYVRAQVLKDDFAPAMEVVADCLLNPVFPAAQWLKLKPVRLDQIQRWDRTWSSELNTYFNLRYFPPGHPYHNPPIGTARSVEKFTIEQITESHRSLAVGANGVLVIVGDIDRAEALTLAGNLFASLPQGDPYQPIEMPQTKAGPRLYIKVSKHIGTSGIQLAFKLGKVMDNLADRAALLLLDAVVSGYRYPSGYLQEALRGTEGRDLVYAVHAYNFVQPYDGYFCVFAGCQEQKLKEVYQIILRCLDQAKTGRIEQAELDLARGGILLGKAIEAQTNAALATRIALDELYGLGFDYHQKLLDALKTTTLEQVVKVAQRFLTDPVIAITTGNPENVELDIPTQAVDPQQLDKFVLPDTNQEKPSKPPGQDQ